MDVQEHEISKAVESLGIHGEQGLASDQKVAVKYLFSNAAAGIVIGRGGSNREELQAKSGARVQLSPSNLFYPGTSDRVLLLSGTVKAVLTALYHILIKLHGGEEAETESYKSIRTQVRIVMPAVVCGSIIGKGGVTIRSFSQDSGTNISMSPQEPGRGLDYDRIITIAGGIEQLLRAMALVIAKIVDNPNYLNNTSMDISTPNLSHSPPRQPNPVPMTMTPVAYTPHSMMHSPMTPPHHTAMYPHMMHMVPSPPLMHHHHQHAAAAAAVAAAHAAHAHAATAYGHHQAMQYPGAAAAAAAVAAAQQGGTQRVEVTMSVPDHAVGAVIGKGGEHVISLKRLLGVKIVVAAKDASRNSAEGSEQGQPGAAGREVRISGGGEAVHLAKMVIMQKLQQVSPQPSSPPPQQQQASSVTSAAASPHLQSPR